MNNTKSKFKSNLIYKLKRSYGTPVSLQQIDQHSVDLSTGEKTTILKLYKINKAIVLRAREFRSFVYDLAFISANKDFTTGGFFDPTDLGIILDVKDLQGYIPSEDDFVIIKNKQYNIKQLEHLDEILILTISKIDGSLDVILIEEHNGLIIEQETSYFIQDRLNRSVVSVLTLTDIVKEVP